MIEYLNCYRFVFREDTVEIKILFYNIIFLVSIKLFQVILQIINLTEIEFYKCYFFYKL